MIHVSRHLPPLKRFRRLLTSDASFKRWPAEIASIRSVNERGFGFAQPLTGPSEHEIFLNESRIASLRAERPSLEGVVVAVQTIQKPDGRVSALDAYAVDMADADVALQLWQQVMHNRRASLQDVASAMALVPDKPVLLPLTLALLDAGVGRGVVPELLRRLPSQAWTTAGTDLQLPLGHADANVKSEVVRHLVAHDPVLAFKYLRSAQVGQFETLTAFEIEKLWTGLAQQRDAFVHWLRYGSRGAPTPGLVTWASWQVEHDSERAAVGWQVIDDAMAKPGAVWPPAWDAWPALQAAPPKVARSLAKQRYRDCLTAITALQGFWSGSVRQLSFDADAILGSLDARDLQLASLWAPAPTRDEDMIAQRQSAQMQTARAAEKCALRYFEGFGQSVRDIAITQLEGSPAAWTVMDLELDGQHGIDVKNCRRTPYGGLRSGKWKRPSRPMPLAIR